MEVIHNVPKLVFDHSPMKPNILGNDELTDELATVEIQRRRLRGDDAPLLSTIHQSSSLLSTILKPNNNKTTHLNRTLSNPFSHSWEHNNIDASSLIVSPKSVCLKDSLNLRWKKELMKILLEKQQIDQDPLFKRIDELCYVTEEERQLFTRNMNQDLIHDDLIFDQRENSKLDVKCGSTKAIIRSLIFFDSFSEEHIKSVLMTHEYWITSKSLFNELISVFWFQNGNVLSTFSIHENYINIWRNYIRKRILKILFIWINTQPYNFKDVNIQNSLIDLVLSLKQTKTVNKSIINVFIKSIRKHIKPKESIKETSECYYNSISNNNISLFDINPKRFSIQISHFESTEMLKIQLNNFKNWKSDLKSQLNYVYNRSKLFQRWIMTEILSAVNLNQSVIILGKFITLMRYCLDLQNFHTTYEIYHALQHERIKNLYSLWKKLNDDILDIWHSVSLKLRSDADYFDSSLEADHPKILPLSLCLKFISSIEKEPTIFNESHYVNFSKLRSIYQILKEFSDSQKMSYGFEPIPEIQAYLKNSITGFDECKLDFLSKEIKIAQSERLNFYLLSPKKNHGNQKERESSSLQSLSARERRISRISVPRKTTSAQTVNSIITKKSSSILNKQLYEEAIEKWQRPLDKCSVGQDLPRFANKIVVVDRKNIIFKPQDNDENLPKRIHDILFTFSELLNAQEEKKLMEERFHRYYDKEKGDTIKETERLIREIFGEKSVVTRLLKATCSQGIVSPAWIKLKLDILNGFHFKDLKKSWYIAVIFGMKDIMVVHRKQEISINDDGEIIFQFTWEMTMTFNFTMTEMISTQLSVVKLEIVNMDDKKASELKAAIKPWYVKNSKYPTYIRKKAKRYSGGDLKKKVKFSLSPPQKKFNETL